MAARTPTLGVVAGCFLVLFGVPFVWVGVRLLTGDPDLIAPIRVPFALSFLGGGLAVMGFGLHVAFLNNGKEVLRAIGPVQH